MAGPEIEVDGCPSCVRFPYKTKGFAPMVLYFAPLSLHLETPAANRPSLLRPRHHRQPACIRVAAVVKLVPAL